MDWLYSHVPAEIWLQIRSYLDIQSPKASQLRVLRQHMLDLCLVCRYFRLLFQPVLFREISFVDWTPILTAPVINRYRIHLLFRTILNNPVLGSYVEKIGIGEHLELFDYGKGSILRRYQIPDDNFDWLNASELEKACMELRSVLENRAPQMLDYWIDELKKGSVDILTALLLSRLKNLKTLKVILDLGRLPRLIPLMHLPSVQEISITRRSLVGNALKSDFIHDEFRHDGKLVDILLRAAPNIRNFELFSLHRRSEFSVPYFNPTELGRALRHHDHSRIEELSIKFYLPAENMVEVTERLAPIDCFKQWTGLKRLKIQLEILLGMPSTSLRLSEVLPPKLEELQIFCNALPMVRHVEPIWSELECLGQIRELAMARNRPAETYLRKVSIIWPHWSPGSREELHQLKKDSNVELCLYEYDKL
ncbi:hypothetical protein AJ80_09435 [Polytolypa hystricis UAMH7299]|uniref:F-box domain-containing protein n=1 Tax=Polytolypa hystricis (strain UAMH7299) TaxID=1447883 RepID=A0A2B7WR57_POLH7|nr:hypothetical protein AJ80_09435 [Polytolypa hystricis UAMH7299]